MSEESTVTSEEPVKPSITLQDIASVVEILKVCTDRGVWRISELSTVGQLYERLVAFLEGAGIAVNAGQAEKE
jgi:hypothetical protein